MLGGRDAGPRSVAWMVHQAAQIICACMVGWCGRTRAIQAIGGTQVGAQVRRTAGGFR